MCLGNVSSSTAGQPLFERAVRYLRRATAIPGFYLSDDMQQYVLIVLPCHYTLGQKWVLI